MRIALVVRGGKLSGKEIAVRTPQFVIGRDETCNLRPASNMVSKLHCALVIADGVVWLRDLKSTNGTFVNGERIGERVQLNDNDEIRVGPLAFQIRIEGDQESQAVAKPSKVKERPASKKSVAEDDVFEWLSEESDEESLDDTQHLEEPAAISDEATLADFALPMTETVADLPDPKTKTPAAPASPTDKDSSSAADNILKGFFVRKR